MSVHEKANMFFAGTLTMLILCLPFMGMINCQALEDGRQEEITKALEAGAAYHHPKTGEIIYKGCVEGAPSEDTMPEDPKDAE